MTHSQAEQISKLVWQEAGFRVYQTPTGSLVDAAGFPLSDAEAQAVQACLNYKSAE